MTYLPASTSQAAPPEHTRPTFGQMIHGVLNFVTLTGRFMALAAAAVFLKEKLHLLKAHMHKDAEAARRLDGHLGQAGADARFQAQAVEVSQAFDRVAEASGILADAADQMEANARGVRDAHQAEYGQIYEVAQASPYDQPKPGFNAVR
ncbi:conjugal transfer protein TraB [Streptomyces scabiei]|uniref:conjugal transfer protein TraB n=1 Tax=Streptomyces scabiei TaxID=1930 RepID=UPI0029A74F4F|nr:conjugal transfer protein TraB [Streptomyces scabiei]MDX2999523.1 conjugal transfer protein TraB [Streptomyces scabiei]MDX3053400.1 conjugal transfer protein TraB [Streptomyces scabiei]MDX3178957.1 conjugal transfer protein TraB [Streptomyces scabiei]